MFNNLQLFEGLSDKEIVTALQSVLTRKKKLVLLLPSKPLVSLVPYELDKKWEARNSDALEQYKIATDELGPFHLRDELPPSGDYLYEQSGLNDLLKPYDVKSDLYWVCDERRIAVQIISSISDNLRMDSEFVWFLIDEQGTKFEVIDRELYSNEAGTKKAFELSSWLAPHKYFGTADPISGLENKKGAYPIDTPEFAAVIHVWEKYWKDGSGMTQDAIVAELIAKGFPKVRAEAIEMICRPINKRGGGRKKNK